MARVQVVYASRHGGTAGIAQRIAEVLLSEGVDAVAVDATERPDPSGVDAYVVGSAVYMGSWLKQGTDYLERNEATLATRPIWLFSSGPLAGSSRSGESGDPLADALGPEDGPGSGGRKKVAALSEAVHARDHRVFLGRFDPADPPTSIPERLVRLMPGSKRILPAGDFREWDAIEGWAREIAGALMAMVPVG